MPDVAEGWVITDVRWRHMDIPDLADINRVRVDIRHPNLGRWVHMIELSPKLVADPLVDIGAIMLQVSVLRVMEMQNAL